MEILTLTKGEHFYVDSKDRVRNLSSLSVTST